MLKNYFKIAFRNILKQKFYAFINIFGLTIGLTSVILIVLYVSDELSYDKFHKDHQKIYRVVENQYYAGQPVFPVAVTPIPLAPSLKKDFAEIDFTTRAKFYRDGFEYDNEYFRETGLYVDPDFFEVFSYHLVRGNPESVFNQVNGIIIDEDLANKYFPNSDPIGKPIRLNASGEMIVTGVIRNIPKNSHLQFSFLMSMDKLRTTRQRMDEDWATNTLYTYIKVGAETKIKSLNEKIRNQIKNNSEESTTEIYLQPLGDIHLATVNFTADVNGNGNLIYVQIFSVIAIFILVIACINFMNLATARSVKRAKEVGLRKTVGASRFQLVSQFLGESIVMSIMALILALLLTDVLLPYFNQLSGKSLDIDLFNYENGFEIILILTGSALFTGILAGSYPAIFLSSFHPTQVLKDQKTRGNGLFRKVLVITQFTVSIVLIIGTITVYNQLNFIQNKNLGVNKDQVVYIPSLSENHDVFQNELQNKNGILSVGFTNQHPAYVNNSTHEISWNGANPDEIILFHTQTVDHGYIPTMGIELIKGRNITDQIADSSAVIINEQALKIIGYDDPIGAKIVWGEVELTIVGVVKDFHFKSIHQHIEPLVMGSGQNWLSRTLIKISNDDIKESISRIKNQWEKQNPSKEFSYSFLDDDFDRLYQAEDVTAKLFSYFSALAIVISCLGLFGLSSFMVEQRTKEIGIRKVLGAPLSNLFFLVSKDFTILVMIAFVLSVPIGWYFMDQWLSSFAYRIQLTSSIFFLSGCLALLIALITVSYQSFEAAASSPIKSLTRE